MRDEAGREYKVCEYCGKNIYRDEPPNNKLNDTNWGLKKYCDRKHKRLAKNPFVKAKQQAV
jgi:hypothetical protein